MDIGIISSNSISSVSDFKTKIRKSLTVDTEKAVYADDTRASYGLSFKSIPDYSEIINTIKRV